MDPDLATVCRNEEIPSYRDLEPVLLRGWGILLAGQLPTEAEVTCEPEVFRRRLGYLMDLAARLGGPPVLADRAARIFRTLPPSRQRPPFFHGDPSIPPGQDDLADRWGLGRGVNLARLRGRAAPRAGRGVGMAS
jgi:hypothetical protein